MRPGVVHWCQRKGAVPGGAVAATVATALYKGKGRGRGVNFQCPYRPIAPARCALLCSRVAAHEKWDRNQGQKGTSLSIPGATGFC